MQLINDFLALPKDPKVQPAPDCAWLKEHLSEEDYKLHQLAYAVQTDSPYAAMAYAVLEHLYNTFPTVFAPEPIPASYFSTVNKFTPTKFTPK